jgi:hypothetical protein
MEMSCLSCQRSEQETPLVGLNYQGKVYYLCSRCFPTLLHAPQKLAGKLPDAETLEAADHDH